LYQFSFLKNWFHRKGAKGAEKIISQLPFRGRQWRSFATLRVIIWPEAGTGLNNPAFHGIVQKKSLRSLRLCGE
jgi:hypothetical protein